MLRLALHTLRHRQAACVATVVALLGAAALIAGCGLLLQTGLCGAVAPERYAAAPIIVSGDQNAHAVMHKKGKTKSKPLAERVWIPERIAGTVRALPAVRAVDTEVLFPAYLVIHGKPADGPHGGPSWGHGWESAPLTPFSLRAGRAPTAAGEIVVDAALAGRTGVHVGSTVTVQATGAPSRYRVVGVAAPGADENGLTSQSAVFFSAAEARALAGHPGRLAALGVWPARGTDLDTLAASTRRALAGAPATVRTGANRGAAELPQAATAKVLLVSLAGALTATSLLVAILAVAGTIGLTIQRRQRELALLRAIGATPGQIRSMVGREALVIGAVASVPGAFAGLAAGRWLHDRLVANGAIPPNLHLAQGPIPLLAAVVMTMAGAWIAGRIASRRAARIRPTAALAEHAAPPVRLGLTRAVIGVLLLAGGVVLVAVLRSLDTEPAATPITFLTSLVWVTALTLLGPPVLRLAGAALSLALRGSPSATGYLAAANVRTGARRYASVAMPVLLAVTMACTILFTQTSLAHGVQQQVNRAVRADYVLRAPNPGLPAAAADAVRHTPGVDTATQIVRSAARGADLASYSVQGITPAGLQRTLDLDVRAGSIRALREGTAAMSTTASNRSGAGVGDHLRLDLGDGTPVTLTVVAVYARGLGFPDLTLTHDLVAAHVDNPLDEVVLVHGKPGLRHALQRAVRNYVDVHVVGGGGGRPALQPAQQGANTSIQYLMLILIAGFAAIGVVNTLMMSTADRRQEFAALRLLGTTRTQICWMVRWESGLLVLIGAALGTAISLPTLSAFSAGMTRSAPYVPALPYIAIIGGTAVLALGAAEAATRAALKAAPVHANTARQ